MQLSRFQKALGLNTKEAEVFLVAIKHGASTAQEFVQQTSLQRTLVYHAIQGLMKKGYLTHSGEKYGKRYQAISSEEILERLRMQVREVEQVLNDVASVESEISDAIGPTLDVKFFVGAEGIRTAATCMLNEASGKLYSIVEMKSFIDSVSKTFAATWFSALAQRKIESVSLWSTEHLSEHVVTGLRSLRILPSGTDFVGGVLFGNDAVTFFFAGKKPGALFVRNKPLVKMMKSLHEQLWSVSSEPRFGSM